MHALQISLLGIALLPLQQPFPQITVPTLNISAIGLNSPRFVIYGDKPTGSPAGPPASALLGYNVYIMSFLQTDGAKDQALAWTQLSPDQRMALKAEYNAAGIKLLVSLFGSVDTPTTNGVDVSAFGQTVVDWVKTYGVDGVDIDYEDLDAMNKGDGAAEAWIISLTQILRQGLPTSIITHAPLAPWFAPAPRWSGGGYLRVHNEVGNIIDWYNLQFYNQGSDSYTTCDNLLTAASPPWGNTAVFEIAQSGVPLDKLVIGKPAGPTDATNGFMSTQDLSVCVQQAIMVWQYPNADSLWISAVRAQAFPV
ncbi:glycoside hydrolase family 18 protein [Mycena floridula]|nr:glycoside hydrolase family 18 protein [Mycena floridula]